jgi:hypothetical protein
MSAREELMRLAPAPAEGSAVVIDWEQFEGSLGVTLPSDYKWLIEAYGPGTFDDFFYVLQPASPFEPIRLAESARRATEILQQLAEHGEAMPYSPGELMPVAKTDNGDTVYWVKRPEDQPGLWTITGNGARNTKWPEFSGGIVEFLLAILSGARRFDIFPCGFPSAHPAFEKFSPRQTG